MWPYTEAETLDIVRQIARTVRPGAGEPTFLSKGSNNEVFLVPTEEGAFVVRVCGDWREVATRREKWCYERASALGIPGPEVFAVGKLEKLPYLAMSFVKGKPGVEYGHKERLWEKLGDYAARINDIRIDEEGEKLYGSKSAWRDRVASCLVPAEFEWLTNQMDWEPTFASEISDCVGELLESDLKVGLSHGDVDPRNAIVAEGGEIYLIDWCCSRWGPVPHVDLYNILRETNPRSSEFKSYLRGYGLSVEEFEAMQAEVHAFGMSELIAELLWANEGRPDLVPERAGRLAKHLNRPYY